MVLLYFFETSLDYHGMTSKELYKLWLRHASAAFKLYDKGLMKYAFKVSRPDISDFIVSLILTMQQEYAILAKPICNVVTFFWLMEGSLLFESTRLFAAVTLSFASF